MQTVTTAETAPGALAMRFLEGDLMKVLVLLGLLAGVIIAVYTVIPPPG